ncbi:hypothetical protein DRW03_19080 [Corallococcus sp. H22C18031201]|nr:hypothetical protein DRW03_19080 [Corallococcus sp. H22C18031201]
MATTLRIPLDDLRRDGARQVHGIPGRAGRRHTVVVELLSPRGDGVPRGRTARGTFARLLTRTLSALRADPRGPSRRAMR